MKRITSILLVLAMVLSSAVLVGCDLSTLLGGEGTTTTTTTTTTTENTSPENPPEELVIKHGDNFTEEDIEFVRNLQGRVNYIGDPNMFTISSMLDNVQSGCVALYLMNLDFENLYYICGYLDNDVYTDIWKDDNYHISMDVTNFVWYKWVEAESVPQTIDGVSLVWTFAVFDCFVEKDTIHGTTYNYRCKYYIECDKPKDISDMKDRLNNGKFLLMQDIEFLYRAESEFIDNRYNRYRSFDVYIDDNSNTYLYFTQSTYANQNCGENLFGDYYNIFSPYFVVIEETVNESGDVYRKAGLELSIIFSILNGAEK